MSLLTDILRCLVAACLAAALAVMPHSAQAQSADAALLVADSVLITTENRLVADGNVEAFFEGTRLFTDKIVYDQEADELIIPGPVRIHEPNGDVFLADSADLDSKLKNGILIGARYVLNEEMQILSAQTDRVGDGRFTVLRKVITTSCQICGNGPPIWQIRSKSAIHDRQEKQIYFKNAQFRLLGVPVLYMPRMRIPDPTLKRTTGFLMPSFIWDSNLGNGLKLPYFITMGDHADLTLTPFVTAKTKTLEYRVRRMFRKGYVEVRGAVSQDALLPGQTRNYLTGFGTFDLGNSFVLSFDVETASDRGYRGTYGYSGRDRLGSGVTLTRVKRDVFFKAEVLNFETLRDNESNDTQPTGVANVAYERRYRFANLGGELTSRVEAHGHRRPSTTDIVGRDMSRIHVDLNYAQDWTLAGGLRAGLTTGLGVDRHFVRDDSTANGQSTSVVPSAALKLSWPLVARTDGGASYLLEPIAQIGWSGGTPSTLPNDESVLVDWDEGNLLSLSRFPTKERRETGTVGAIGLRWQRLHAESWSAGLTIGQVFRQTADPSFSRTSGLQSLTSDTLLSLYAETAWGGAVRARGLFDAGFDPVKVEAQFSYARNKWSVSGNYVELQADTAENRTSPVAEWSLNSTYRVSRHWTAAANWQYDLLTDRAARTGGKVTYQNECISIGLGAARSFASSSTLVPKTTYELAIALRGFSTGGSGKAARRQCTTY